MAVPPVPKYKSQIFSAIAESFEALAAQFRALVQLEEEGYGKGGEKDKEN